LPLLSPRQFLAHCLIARKAVLVVASCGSCLALLSWALLHAATEAKIDANKYARLHGGVDVGRINDRTSIALVGQEHAQGDWIDNYAVIHFESHKGVAFDAQRGAILAVDGRYAVQHWGIDRTGIGMQLAEELCAVAPERFEGVWFSAQRKSRLALSLLKLLEEKRLILPNDPDLLAQLHAVKKQVSGQTIRYDAARNDDGHADLFWAVALATEGRAGGALAGGFGVEVF
jgi:phage FluMu gp28-like protein